MRTRVTGVCVEDDRILLLDQDTDGPRSWSLPGGKVAPGETLAEALVREMREETGVLVDVGRMLYLCDHVPADVVHITFEVRRVGGVMGDVVVGADTRPIRGVAFVKLTELPGLGFSERFVELAMAGWPGAGSYHGRQGRHRPVGRAARRHTRTGTPRGSPRGRRETSEGFADLSPVGVQRVEALPDGRGAR